MQNYTKKKTGKDSTGQNNARHYMLSANTWLAKARPHNTNQHNRTRQHNASYVSADKMQKSYKSTLHDRTTHYSKTHVMTLQNRIL